MTDPKELEESASSPTKKTTTVASASSSIRPPKQPIAATSGPAKTEVPTLPPTTYEVPKRSRDDPLVIGNKSYELGLTLDGRLGFTKSRENSMHPAVNVLINRDEYRNGVFNVISHVLKDLHRLKRTMNDADTTPRVDEVANTITNGIMLMTYLKLRAINLFRPSEAPKFRSKPKVPEPFEVPEPFGFAISQLGVVEVSSTIKRMTVYPTATTAHANEHLLVRRNQWSQTAYTEAVRYAKDLGMTFKPVNLNVKVGSSWWLFKPHLDSDIFSLRCQLPEDNFTLAGAVIRTLFYIDNSTQPASEIFNLAVLPDKNYGSFIRGPREGIAFATYYAISSEGVEEFWKSAT